jgi:hypothetical protein
MLFDTFLMKDDNIVPALSDEKFVRIVAFVQDSETYVMQLSTKRDGKWKLSLAMFCSMKFCEAKRYQLDKRISKRELYVVNLTRNLPPHQKTDAP